jgi:antitoxin CptB
MTDIAARRRMLKFRASHRGLRELDLFFEAFLAAQLDGLDEEGLDQLEAILDIPDQQVYAWILGQAVPPAEMRAGVLDLLLSFRYAARSKHGVDPTG